MRMLAITFRDFLGEFSTFAFLFLSLPLFCIVDDPLTVGKCPKWRIQPRHTLSSELSISGILSPAFFVSLLFFPLRYLTLLTFATHLCLVLPKPIASCKALVGFFNTRLNPSSGIQRSTEDSFFQGGNASSRAALTPS